MVTKADRNRSGSPHAAVLWIFVGVVAAFLLPGDECGSDPRQAEAAMVLGAEDRPAQPADGPGGEPHEEQRPDPVRRHSGYESKVLSRVLMMSSNSGLSCSHYVLIRC